MAVQLIARLREALQVDIAVADLFQAPQLSALAHVVLNASIARFEAQDVDALGADLDALSHEELLALLEEEG